MGQNVSKAVRQVPQLSRVVASRQEAVTTSKSTTSTGRIGSSTTGTTSIGNNDTNVDDELQKARDIARGVTTTTDIQETTTAAETAEVPESVRSVPVADSLSGFYRGSGPISDADWQQKQFLAKQQQQQQRAATETGLYDDTTTKSISKLGSSPVSNGDSTNVQKQQETQQVPFDLLKFINAVGPVRTNDDDDYDDKNKQNKQKRMTKSSTRLPRHLQRQQEEEDNEEKGTHLVTTKDDYPVVENSQDKSQSRFYDKTRQVTSMRLAKDVEGYETNRTTSFSHKRHDDNDPSSGLSIMDLYKLLSANANTGGTTTTTESSFTSRLLETTTSTTETNETESVTLFDSEQIPDSEQQKQLTTTTATTNVTSGVLQAYTNALQYTQVPVLMRNIDGTYVGSFAQNVSTLQDMKLQLLLSSTSNDNDINTGTGTSIQISNVKLVLQDIHEMSLKKPIRDESSRQRHSTKRQLN